MNTLYLVKYKITDSYILEISMPKIILKMKKKSTMFIYNFYARYKL